MVTALTIIKAIALADGILPDGERYLTKYQMITLCKRWLEQTNAQHRSRSATRITVARKLRSPT